MIMPTARATIEKILEREKRTGDVWTSNLLEAVVGLFEHTEALEQRIAAMEKNQAAVTCGETAKRVFTDLYAESDADTDDRPVAPSEERSEGG